MPDASFTYTSYIRATPERIWQTFTPEFGEAVGDSAELLAAMASEKRSTVFSSLKSLLETGDALAFS